MLNLIKTNFQDYLIFLKKPNPHPRHHKLSSSEKWKSLLIFILIDFLLVIPAVVIIYIIQEFSGLDIDNHAISDFSNSYGIALIIISGGIISPFIEEIIFRLPLNYKRNYLFKLVGLVIGKETVRNFWFRYYTIFFYLFVVAFGAVHISNYKDESIGIILLSPLLVLPQIIGGTVIAYLRMNLGFFWGFLQHALFNSALMIFAFYFNVEEKVMINNDDYKLKIEVAQNRFGNDKTIKINKEIDLTTEIKTQYATFNQVAREFNWEIIEQKENYKHFNIDFEVKNTNTNINSDSVLQHHLRGIIEED
ncbi:hypothetical protein [Marivirga sp.]|uniref:hypothetical protein n=1 Tax=Marivirga sp. TaxID=2018662 RepID=UPI002D7E3886|nr:hypothetical protein [Marivirga sp.]HET8858421.1 hypothetical protein [Marivirga sp.]